MKLPLAWSFQHKYLIYDFTDENPNGLLEVIGKIYFNTTLIHGHDKWSVVYIDRMSLGLEFVGPL